MNKSTFSSYRFIVMLSLLIFISCKKQTVQVNEVNIGPQDSIQLEEVPEPAIEEVIDQDLLALETEFAEMLSPIASLKLKQPKTYWFIVSWLKTNYRTPNWKGYYSEEWKITTKKRGIDCSGFSRVMLDQIFDKKVSGGSQGLLDYHCTQIGSGSLEMGDLVFFRAPYATNDRIVHVGVYLQDGYFVHATSTKSAARDLGLSVNSLDEENWAKEFVAGGKVKD